MGLFPGRDPGLVARVEVGLVPGLAGVGLMGPGGLVGRGGVVPRRVAHHAAARRTHQTLLQRGFALVLRVFQLFNLLLLFFLLFALSVPDEPHVGVDGGGDSYLDGRVLPLPRSHKPGLSRG